jgi:geranylgeranyl pyrophosphate synthase
VHLIYGTDIAVNSGNFMYYAPMLAIMKSGKYNAAQLAKLNEIYVEEMVQLHIGQGWDILWHNIDKLEGKYPTENQYLQMTAHKTGVLARLSARMVCAVLEVSEKDTKSLARFVENLGVAFQIQDDLLNL